MFEEDVYIYIYLYAANLADNNCHGFFKPPGKDEVFLEKTKDKTQQIYVGCALGVVLMGIAQSKKNGCLPSAFP